MSASLVTGLFVLCPSLILRTIVKASLAMRFTHSYAAAAVAFFLRGVPVGEARTSPVKRWVPSDPQAFEVELGFDSVGRYLATIGMVRCRIHFTALTVDRSAKRFSASYLLGQAFCSSWKFQLPPVHMRPLYRCGCRWLRDLCLANRPSTSVCPSCHRK